MFYKHLQTMFDRWAGEVWKPYRTPIDDPLCDLERELVFFSWEVLVSKGGWLFQGLISP